MKLDDLKIRVDKLASELKFLITKNNSTAPNSTEIDDCSNRAPSVTVTFFVNKVYEKMEQKMDILLSPFRADKVLSSQVDLLATTWSPHFDRFSKEYRIPFVYIPFTTDIRRFNNPYVPWDNRRQRCDLFLSWDKTLTRYGELRQNITDHQAVDIVKYEPDRLLSDAEYLQAVLDCKMAASTIGMPGRFDLLGTRYYEVMASNTTLLLLQEPETKEAKYAYDIAGLVSGQTYAGFRNLQEYDKQLTYYAKHEKEARKIIHAASAVAMQRHSWKSRAEDIVSAIRSRSRNKSCTETTEGFSASRI